MGQIFLYLANDIHWAVKYEQLISKLVSARNDQGLQQQELAEKLGVKKQNVNNWEKLRSRPKLEVLSQWVTILNMTFVVEVTDDPDFVQAQELNKLLKGLPEERKTWVLRFAHLAYTMSNGDFRMIRAMLRELETETEADHGPSANEGTSRSA